MAKSPRIMRERADRAMSIFIRTKYAVDGYVKCITCDAIRPIAEMDSAHFISRGKAATRFLEANCHPACQNCNRFRQLPHMRMYTLFMIDTYGREFVDQLIQTSRELVRHRISDYEGFAAHYNDKLGEL